MSRTRKNRETMTEAKVDSQHSNRSDEHSNSSQLAGANTQPPITIEAVNRVLEVGRILRSVLTEEELSALRDTLNAQKREENLLATKPRRRSRKEPDAQDQAVKK